MEITADMHALICSAHDMSQIEFRRVKEVQFTIQLKLLLG